MNRHTTATIKKQLFQGSFLLGVALAVAYPTRPIFAQHASGDQTLVHAGVRWVWQNPLPQGNWLFGVSFTDANNGTAVGWYGTILRTTDGGRNWVLQPSGILGTNIGLYGVSFTDANTGTVVGGVTDATILRTTDGGANWVSQTSETNYLKAVSFTDTNTGTAVGGYGTIVRT